MAALIDTHFRLMRSQSPEESCHVLPADALADEMMLAAVSDGDVLGIGALAEVVPGHGEIKSMHTAAAARGRGVARKLLRALLEAAEAQGMTRVSLETGSAPEFAAARALYQSEGFAMCPPFGSYVVDPLSVYMTRDIARH